jgi:rhodanese-related sulfurtransferase
MRYLLSCLAALLVLGGCQPDAPPNDADASALTPEQVRVVTAIAALDSMRIARATTITADEDVDAETFARVCKPVGLRARELSEENGWRVRQIATRYRNPANAAAPGDSALFAQFEADPDLVDRWLDATHDGVPGQRYVRRIAMQGTCLACHGARDERPAFVVETYPEDRAFGFEPGDLRGLYSVFVPDSTLSATADPSSPVRAAALAPRLDSPNQPSSSIMSFFSRLLGGSAASAGTLAPTDFVDQRDPDAPVIDVRTPAEFAGGHLAGAVNVDIFAPDFQEQIEALDLPGEGPVYLYCRSGNRSGKAAQVLRQMGYDDAVNVGGFEALKAAGAETR